MDVLRLLQTLWRRRWIVLPTALLVLVAIVLVYLSSPRTFRADAAVVLLNPPAPSVTPGSSTPPGAANPFTRFTDSSVMVDIVSRRLASPAVVQIMRDKGMKGKATVGANLEFYRGPIISVTTESPSAEAATADARIAMDEIATQLRQLQAEQGTAPEFSITTATVVSPDRASEEITSLVRRLAAVSAVGVLLVLLVGVGAEAWAVRRASRIKHRRSQYSPERDLALETRPDSAPLAPAQREPSNPESTQPVRAAMLSERGSGQSEPPGTYT